MGDDDWVDQLKVVELRKRLKERGENSSGKKAVLVERLKESLKKDIEDNEDVKMEDAKKDDVEEKSEKADEIREKEESRIQEVQSGLKELLGDGTDDLKLDFETEKPSKKQKVDQSGEKPKVVSESEPTESSDHPKKDDEVDFEAIQNEPKEDQKGKEEQISKSDSTEREAPPVAEEDRTRALRIQNFVRPFTEKAAKEMLAAFGTIVDMWMPPIKTHCFVVYEKESEAHDAYLGTYNAVWPRSGKHLRPQFVGEEEAKTAIEEGRAKVQQSARASGSSSYQKNRLPQSHSGPNSPTGRNGGGPRTPSKPALSLEDLFFKTQSKPPIYYLPLTDEQVAEKKRKQGEIKEDKGEEQAK